MEYLKIIAVVIFLVVFASCFVLFVVYWLRMVKHGFAMTRHYKEGINKWGSATLFNPFNGLVMRNLLTEQGVVHAKKCRTAFIKLFIVGLLPFIVGYVTELLTGVQFIAR